MSIETRNKMSIANKGRKHKEETKKKISKWHTGKHLSEETKRKLSEYHKGRKLSDETRRKLSIANKGRKHKEETKKKISDSNTTPVLQYSLDGNYIREWDSIKQIKNTLGLNVTGCCSGIYSSSGGFQWKWKESQEFIEFIGNYKEQYKKKRTIGTHILQIDKDTDEIIKEWKDLKSIHTELGINVSNICLVCNGKYKTAGGFKWRYKSDSDNQPDK